MAASVILAVLAACTSETANDPGTSQSPAVESPEESSTQAADDPTGEPSQPPGDDDSPADTPPSDTGDAAPGDGQTVAYGDFRFDVPAGWEVSTQEVDGTDVPRPAYGRGFCPEDPDQMTGTVEITWAEGETDPVQAVTDEAQREVERYFGDRDATAEVGDVRHSGAWAAAPVTVDLADSDDPCDGDEAMVAIKGAAVEDGTGTVFLVVVGELGLEGSPRSESVIEISNSFRGAGEE